MLACLAGLAGRRPKPAAAALAKTARSPQPLGVDLGTTAPALFLQAGRPPPGSSLHWDFWDDERRRASVSRSPPGMRTPRNPGSALGFTADVGDWRKIGARRTSLNSRGRGKACLFGERRM